MQAGSGGKIPGVQALPPPGRLGYRTSVEPGDGRGEGRTVLSQQEPGLTYARDTNSLRRPHF